MITNWLHAPGWLPLAHALLHTLWQAALAAAGLFLVLRWIPARQTNWRYALSVVSLAIVLLMGIAGWATLDARSRLSGNTATKIEAAAMSNTASRLPNTASERRPPGGPGTPLVAVPPRLIKSGNQWLRLAVALWLLGTSIKLVQTCREVVGVGRLRRRGVLLTDPGILAMADELCGRLRISCRVRFLVSPDVIFPSVMGVFAPAILLPAAMLAGLSVHDLRAILAHELAHIRRWDYLANLGQMVVEAVLFFNPFVWWISRQIRLEREACCDRVAADECESAASYIEVLVAVVEHRREVPGGGPIPAMAMAGPRGWHGDQLLDRTRRLLVPGYMPAPRLRWFSLTLVLTISAVVLASFWAASRAVAQTIVAPQPSKRATSDQQILGKATVLMEDGSPLGDDQATVHVFESYGLGGSSHNTIKVEEEGRAPIWFFPHSESVTVAAVRPGYATAFASPITAPLKEKLDGLSLTLAKGFNAQMQIVDEAGQPIPGAKLSAYYPGPPKVSLADEIVADATGSVLLEHIGTAPLNVRVIAEGYQADEIPKIALDPSTPYRWTLRKAKALEGVVMSRPTGQTLAGAQVKLAGVRGPHDETYSDPSHAPVLAVSDAQGRFRLTSLRPDSRYFLFVEAAGHSGVLLGEIKADQTPLKVALGPEIFVRGKFLHVTEADGHRGRFHFGYGQMFKIGDGFAETGYSRELELKDGEAAFNIGPFYEWPVSIRMGSKEVKLETADLPKSDLVIDLSTPPAPR